MVLHKQNLIVWLRNQQRHKTYSWDKSRDNEKKVFIIKVSEHSFSLKKAIITHGIKMRDMVSRIGKLYRGGESRRTRKHIGKEHEIEK
jgi:hypothetical protein